MVADVNFISTRVILRRRSLAERIAVRTAVINGAPTFIDHTFSQNSVFFVSTLYYNIIL